VNVKENVSPIKAKVKTALTILKAALG